MKNVNITVYEYNELSDKAKRRAHNDFLEKNYFDSVIFNERITEHTEDMAELGYITDPDKYRYSVNNGQGSFAYFDTKLDLAVLLPLLIDADKLANYKLVLDNTDLIDCGVEKGRTFGYDISYSGDEVDTEELARLLDELEPAIVEDYKRQCRSLYVDLTRLDDDLSSEERFIEDREANERLFYKNGNLYTE